ncbi:hypothetical protein L195_g034344 [Trifolium pratense]|uniref:Reverse transcriptase zinc-binding domain-containing protein n=1 Tax=Trifolium pratense TaxID=57577 RepID=A0A2K3LIM2_TRIPR|nr:hypothetical protein L195_g034344 [Trifolium pratense]
MERPAGSMWKNVLASKYGGVGHANLSVGRGNKFSLGVRSGGRLDSTKKFQETQVWWFDVLLARPLGWLAPLCDTFPRLYQMSLQSAMIIKDMGEWVNESWCWKFAWRRNFFSWEENLFAELSELIASISITKAVDSWSFELGGQFSVSAMYMFLYGKFLPPSFLGLIPAGVNAKVWDSWAPTKVVIFSWQALLGRLPTKENLMRRGFAFERLNV